MAIGAVMPGAQASVALLIVAFVIDLVKKDSAIGTWQESHFRWRIRTVLWAAGLYLVTAPLWLLLLRAQSVRSVLIPFALLMALGLAWLGPAAADMQDLVAPRHRGLGIGVYFFVVNVLASGVGQPIIGAISDRLHVGAEPWRMRQSLLVCPAAALLSAALLLGARASRRARAAS